MSSEINFEKRRSLRCDRCFADGVDDADNGKVDEEDWERVGPVLEDSLGCHYLRKVVFFLFILVFDVDIGSYYVRPRGRY